MVANGFVSFPSSQILYIIVGYFVGTGYLSFLPASLIGAFGNTIGNILLYETVRRYGIQALQFMQIYKAEEVRKVEVAFQKRGTWFLFVAKLLPAIKVFAPIPPALGHMHRGKFITIMLAASWVWSWIFIAIGFTFGKSTSVFKTYGIVLVFIALIVVYAFYRYINSKEVIASIEGEKSK